ncbi:MAG: hypothetical protein Fur0021_17700 [Candidatus Promineifilaceae bacterium]
MNRLRGLRRVMWGISLLLLAILCEYAPPARAHGGGALQVSNAAAGPYLVSVWTQSDTLRPGPLHVTIAVSQPAPDGGSNAAGEPVLGAVVRVVAQPLPANGAKVMPIETLATSAAALNKLYYEADFEVAQAGMWRFLIEVSGPDGSGSLSFEQEVLPAVKVGWPVWASILGVLALAGWLAQSRARPGTPSARPARPAHPRQS